MKTIIQTPLVLIADDTVPMTLMLQRVFEYEGYRVHVVHDGIATLAAARQLVPDLLLLDVNMPGMNGFQVLEQLRADPKTATIPTILITALSELSDIVHGLQLGADDYVRKPFHWRELLARAQSKMRAHKLESELQRRTIQLEALLHISQELNQHLEIDEILELILRLTLTLLGGEAALIYQLNPQGDIMSVRSQQAADADHGTPFQVDHVVLLAEIIQQSLPLLWDDATPLDTAFPNGIAVPLQVDDQNQLQTLLILVSEMAYDNNDLQLLSGIGRQASMALRNAELYRLKANYALHLEDMVEARTHELRSAQQMLIRSEKLASVGRLAASIAHEINNPLLPIQINLDDMLEDLQVNRAIDPQEIVRTQESVERIRRIVNRLLEFTGNSYIVHLERRQLDLNALIQNVCDLIRNAFEQQGQQIKLDLALLPTIYGDKDGLEQVFLNLALNASEAMKRKGILTIKTMRLAESIIVTVSDNGSGITPDIIEKMFEPFVSTKEDGNGLGLFISYGIIQSHHGSIEVDSQVNVGTTFTVRLPISEDQTSSKPPSNSKKIPKKLGRSR